MSICLNLPDAAASCKMNIHSVTSLADRPVVFCITQINVGVKQFKNEGEWFSDFIMSVLIHVSLILILLELKLQIHIFLRQRS